MWGIQKQKKDTRLVLLKNTREKLWLKKKKKERSEWSWTEKRRNGGKAKKKRKLVSA